jgi:hypothetical protein
LARICEPRKFSDAFEVQNHGRGSGLHVMSRIGKAPPNGGHARAQSGRRARIRELTCTAPLAVQASITIIANDRLHIRELKIARGRIWVPNINTETLCL